MSDLSFYCIPLIVGGILVYGIVKGVAVFDVFLDGAKEGIMIAYQILPALIALMTCVGMFKASGGLDILTNLLSPVANIFSIPTETIPLALLRPISGSGALVIYEDILKNYGPDSIVGKMASVMMGSTETTFYTIAIYFGSSKITKTRYTLFCALVADFMGFFMSCVFVKVFFL